MLICQLEAAQMTTLVSEKWGMTPLGFCIPNIKLANFPSSPGLMGYRRPGLRGTVSPALEANGNHMVIMEHQGPPREQPLNNI